MHRFFLSALSLIFLVSCADAPTTKGGTSILVMGDSLLASNRWLGASVGQELRKSLRADVVNMPTPGARMIYDLPVSGALGMDIRQQYRIGNWDWVILNGGGNDIWFGCACHKCERKLDRLISADGRSGEIPKLIARMRQTTDAQIIYLGYLSTPGVTSPIESCSDEGRILDARLERFANMTDGFVFISNADLVPDGDTSFHRWDQIHPSINGSREISRRVLDVIASASP